MWLGLPLLVLGPPFGGEQLWGLLHEQILKNLVNPTLKLTFSGYMSPTQKIQACGFKEGCC